MESLATVLQPLRHGDAQDMIQRVNFTLHAAAVFQIEKRVALGSKDVAGAQDV